MTHDDQHQERHDEADAPAQRVRALESLLAQKGLIDPSALDAIVEAYETQIGPRNGAQVVARAWVDAAYRERLLVDGAAAIAELGFGGLESEQLVVLENKPEVHNMVVCTLCSCYPWAVLGLPPSWYKAAPYRSRVVKDPRGVLAEFGMTLPAGTAVRVWDSTADLRYLVLPRRPEGSEALDAAALADLVTRDGMIGTAPV